MRIDAGKVWLVGAGPGDPDLITLRGLEALERSDVVIYDRLVSPRLIERAVQAGERIYVGKRPDLVSMSQQSINRLIVDRAGSGLSVVRLKGGDPFVFGRGGEEILALIRAGIPFEVVPGVSAALAVPAAAGIPVTHRSLGSCFAVVSGHQCTSARGMDWGALSRIPTLVVLMGLATLEEWSSRLRDEGMDPDTPVAVISRGTMADQRVVRGTLSDIAALVRDTNLPSPATVVVGEVVRFNESSDLVSDYPAGNPDREKVYDDLFQDVA